jgi:hypothetical protein
MSVLNEEALEEVPLSEYERLTVERRTPNGDVKYIYEHRIAGEMAKFTIERRAGSKTWFCHSGISFRVHPEDQRLRREKYGNDSIFAKLDKDGDFEGLCLSNHAGWGTSSFFSLERGHQKCLQKVLKSVRRAVLERQRKRDLGEVI